LLSTLPHFTTIGKLLHFVATLSFRLSTYDWRVFGEKNIGQEARKGVIMASPKELEKAFEHSLVVLTTTGQRYLQARKAWEDARDAWVASLKAEARERTLATEKGEKG